MSRILPLIIIHILTVSTFAQTPARVEHFVRVKGQEATQIHAFGIVSGLNGTGDDVKSLPPFAQMILRQLERSGMNPGNDIKSVIGIKNSALVEVTVTIPANGARDGDALDCTVFAVGNAKSLSGGVLSMTTLSTPTQQDANSLVYGMASGRVSLDQTSSPNVGRVVNGCRITRDFFNQYIEDGLINLVIKKEFARPNLANNIAYEINQNPLIDGQPAQAVNSNFVVVRVPKKDLKEPMDFLMRVLDTTMRRVPPPVPRILINERTGGIAVGQDVEVKPTAITYLNIVADLAPNLPDGETEQFPRHFIGIDSDTKLRQMQGENVNNIKLKSLIACLDELRATPMEIIEIIKLLQAQGAIVGEVVFVD